MKHLKFIAVLVGLVASAAAGAVELKNGAEFAMKDVPEELTVKVKRGGTVRFLVEENATTGYQWEATYASNECAVVIEHRGADTSNGLCGAPGKAAFKVTKNAAVQSPSLVEFAYRRSWEKGAPAKKVRLVLYTIPGEEAIVRLDLKGSDIWTPSSLARSAETRRLQAEIDAASAKGGGVVTLARGVHECGTLHLKRGVELHFEDGAVLQGGGKGSDYEDVIVEEGLYPERSKKVLIVAENADSIAITGNGVIDVQGEKFFDTKKFNRWGSFWEKPPHPRPRAIQFINCRGVRIEGVKILNSPNFAMWLRRCTDVIVSRIRIEANPLMINSDGVDIDACRHVRFGDSTISTGDDCLSIRTMRGLGSEKLALECSDVIVSNCVLKSACQTLRIGCPSDDVIRDVLLKDITATGNNGIISRHPYSYLKPNSHGYLKTDNIVFENWKLECSNCPIWIDAEPGITLRDFGHMTFRNITLKGRKPITVQGCAETMIRDLRFENLRGSIDAVVPFDCRGVEGLVMKDVELTSGKGEATAFKGRCGTSWETDWPTREGGVLTTTRPSGDAKCRFVRNLAYRQDAPECVLDLCLPTALKGFPTVVWFHGGGLTGGNRDWIALDTNRVAIATVEYRLMPKVGPETCLDDAAAAAAWVKRHIAEYGGDPKTVFVAGHSAGGYLTFMLGLDDRWLNKYSLTPFDFAGYMPLSGQVTKHFAVRKQLGDRSDGLKPIVDKWAPMNYLKKSTPPFCVVVGDRRIEWKMRVEENEFMFESLKAMGNTAFEFHSIPNTDHGSCRKPAETIFQSFVDRVCH